MVKVVRLLGMVMVVRVVVGVKVFGVVLTRYTEY